MSAWNSRFRLTEPVPQSFTNARLCLSTAVLVKPVNVFQASKPCFKAQPRSYWPKALDQYKQRYLMSGPCVVNVAAAEWV